MSSARQEFRQPARLELERRSPGAFEAGANEPLAESRIGGQAVHGGSGSSGITRLDQNRAVAEHAHAPDGRRDRRQSARIGLEQDLGQALGARDVQEDMAGSVHLEQPAVQRHVAAQLAMARQLERLDAIAQRVGKISLPADHESPSPVALPQGGQDVREQQRVLLGVEATDGEQGQLGSVVLAERLRPGAHVLGGDQRDRDLEQAPASAVAPGQVRTHDDDGIEAGESPPESLEQPGGEPQVTPARMAVADVGGIVLAHAEHQATAAQHRDHREGDRVRLRSEREHRVGVVERAPHASERSWDGTRNPSDVGESRVVRQRDELDLGAERVVHGARALVEAPEKPQPAALLRERTEEANERALAEDHALAGAIGIVGVDDQRHDAVAVSVLIPVRDEGSNLARAVPAMLAQRFDGELEFIFAEGCSVDDTRARLERFAALDGRVRIVDNPSGRTPDGLNIALAHARGEFVARMDAHAMYPPAYLADAVARLKLGDVAWVAGPKRPRAHGGASGAIALALSSPLGQGPSRHLARRRAAANDEYDLDTGVFTGVWRRASLERHGGWDSVWLRNQDSELAARFLAAGERIVSLERMTADYLPRRTLRSFWRQYHQYGRYRARTLVRHPIARRGSHALAPALVAAVPAAAMPFRAMSAPARAGLAAYGLLVAAETVRAARTAPPSDAIRLPAVFAVMHGAFGSGMWRGLAETFISSQRRTR